MKTTAFHARWLVAGLMMAAAVACAATSARSQSADLALCDRIAADPSDPDKPAEVKGTHMSRFVEVLESQPIELDAAGLRPMMNAMLNRLGATSGHIAFSFPSSTRRLAGIDALVKCGSEG